MCNFYFSAQTTKKKSLRARLLVMLAVALSSSSSSAESRIPLSLHPCLLPAFASLLRTTFQNVESAAFVVEESGAPRLLLWPRRAWGPTQIFRGPQPNGTVAVVHTHFTNEDKPSPDDEAESRRLHLPFYVVTHTAVSVFDPETARETQIIAGRAWVAMSDAMPANCTKPQPLR